MAKENWTAPFMLILFTSDLRFLHMRFVLCLAFLFLFSTIQAQKINFSEPHPPSFTHVKGGDFEGVIFSENFVFPFLANQAGDRRFTPSNAEIEIAEGILNQNIKSINASKLNQGQGRGPVIHESLDKFVRQYFGYYSSLGEKIVFISCLLKENYRTISNQEPNWLKGAVLVLNGGSNYWQVQANLNSSKLFGLKINGIDKTEAP